MAGFQARELRAEQTQAEARLWARLRNRQMDGRKFRRQVPLCGYFADFARREAMLVVELDGGHHADALACDAARSRILENAGYRVPRFWNREVLTELGNVLQAISAEIRLARG